MSDNAYLRIIRKTGRKPIQCKCKDCKKQCRTPCMGTPSDILKLIEAGYASKLSMTEWGVALLYKRHDSVVLMVQATAGKNGCAFFRDGLCDLHDLGLKPTEGKLSHHSVTLENYKFSKGLAWNVAKEWLSEDNIETITRVFRLFAQHSES